MIEFKSIVDKLFYDLDYAGMLETGYTADRETHMGGTFLFDCRISYELKKHIKFALIVNNIFNTEYSPRPLKIDAPRTTTLQVSYKI